MKMHLNLLSGTLFFIFISASQAFAQDWIAVAPKGKDVKVDNDFVRTIVVSLSPGDKEASHTHPAHVYYVIAPGKVKVKYSDGKEDVAEIKAGDCGYSDPERPHILENVGTTTIKFLVVELKEHPYKK
jgi:mannose-6-phosphate isomerase-like protein (cupin superfamily)